MKMKDKIDKAMEKRKIHMGEADGKVMSQYERDGWLADLAEHPPEKQGEYVMVTNGKSMMLAIHGAEGVEFYDVIVKRKGGLW